jgi:hypothetical protein
MKVETEEERREREDDKIIELLQTEESATFGARRDLAAGVPIVYADDDFPETTKMGTERMVREFPDGKRYIVKLTFDEEGEFNDFKTIRQITDSSWKK